MVMRQVDSRILDHFSNRCSALTRRGHPCKNPVFYSQWYSWDTVVDEELPDGRQVVRKALPMHNGDYARMTASVCTIHELHAHAELTR